LTRIRPYTGKLMQHSSEAIHFRALFIVCGPIHYNATLKKTSLLLGMRRACARGSVLN
jgi:hypothetical protein